MANISRKSTWKNRTTKQQVKVLDIGVWALDLETRKKKTYDIETFETQFEEQKEEKKVKEIRKVNEIINPSHTFPAHPSSSDRLQDMFELQKDFQEVVGNGHKIYQKYPDNPFIVESTISLIDELMEALRETPWKAWKKDQKMDIGRMREEIIDSWHFLINLSMAAGMTPEQVYSEFLKKNEINRQRRRDEQ